jgi:protein involved in polysaccharide export with SLBB domain
VAGIGFAHAQTVDAAGDALQRLLQNRGSADQFGIGQSGPPDQRTPPIQVYQPAPPAQQPIPPSSRLEMLYYSRAGRALTQFGYDVLGVPTPITAAQVGGVQDNYVLGEGDELIFDLRGQENTSFRQRVDRNGQIILPKLNPVPATGRTLGGFRADIERQVAQAYVSTNVFVSVAQTKQISVLVTGEVRSPGTRILSGLSTPLDALLLSGGIAKTGSLRNVLLIRDNQAILLDLYTLLLQGTLPNVGGLRNGDRLYVPPLHNTVAVAGFVRRPGIYELRDGQNALDVNDLIQVAGGLEIAGTYRFSKLHLESDGSTRLISFTQGQVSSGEILFVDSATDVSLERVNLGGAVRLPGTYPRTTNSTISRLIHNSEELAPEAYASFAVIVRRDPRLNVRSIVPFSLAQIFSGGSDVTLENDDLVYIFGRNQIRLLADIATTQQELRLRPLRNNMPGNEVGRPNTANLSNYAPYAGATSAIPFNPAGTPPTGITPGAPPPPPAISNPNGPEGNSRYGAPYGATGPYAYSGAGATPSYGFPSYGFPAYGFPASPYGAMNAPPGSTTLPYGTMPYGTMVAPYTPYGGQSPPASFPPTIYGLQQQQPFSTGSLQTLGPNGQPAFPQSPNSLQQSLWETQPQPLTPDGIAFVLGVPQEALVRTIADHIIWILDEVRDPGAYVASEGATVAEMIQTAGGILRQADLSSVEVTSTEIVPQLGSSRTLRTVYKGEVSDFQRVPLRPFDVIRLHPIFSDRESGRITVSGQVRYPGTFDITRGERLSSVLGRAGGLTDTAYPYGAVFTRERAGVAERDGREREAREVNAQIASLASSPNANDRDKVSFLTSLGERIRNEPVLGRITITADPAVLQVRPELDITLEPGDTLFVPPRPSTITVTGEVLNAGSFQYEAGLDVNGYIARAGDVSQGADKERIFIVLPDGTARPFQESWLAFRSTNLLPPGSTIVVPRDLRPFDLTTFLRDATQITSQLAVTAASLVVIGR